ncbi:hypothetical protein P835_03632 [Citrobacter portucalensis]|uniref:tetratricopeptide repeat protein n=1 Tax=Citrobacter portucalensis TaxID=1639133 RepID=UPI00044D9AAD|nr:tetratricopeptide repeat protein [Citrobacter portucalensis]ETX62230.1 hypothetical protein P835_03632 [Citrobacter portucalensis]
MDKVIKKIMTVICVIIILGIAAGYIYCWNEKDGSVRIENSSDTLMQITKAAEQGDVKAQFELGSFYEHGNGVTQDYTRALKWYRKSAEQGYKYAQYNLGTLYDNAKGVSQSYEAAKKWYQRAAEQGLDVAQFNLGLFYSLGRGGGEKFYASC